MRALDPTNSSNNCIPTLNLSSEGPRRPIRRDGQLVWKRKVGYVTRCQRLRDDSYALVLSWAVAFPFVTSGTVMKNSALREPPVHVVLIDNRGTILDVSTKSGRSDGSNKAALALYPVGESYFDHCDDADHVADVQMLLKRKRSLISYVVPAHPPKQKQWFVVIGVPVSADIGSGAVLMHVDIAAWLPETKDDAHAPKPGKAPTTLNPGLIQDTIAKALFQQFGPGFGEAPAKPLHPDVETLSPRQREVLMLLGAGKSNAEIAEELSCSLNTVKRHVTAVLQKLRLPNRTRAAMIANQLAYVQVDD